MHRADACTRRALESTQKRLQKQRVTSENPLTHLLEQSPGAEVMWPVEVEAHQFGYCTVFAVNEYKVGESGFEMVTLRNRYM